MKTVLPNGKNGGSRSARLVALGVALVAMAAGTAGFPMMTVQAQPPAPASTNDAEKPILIDRKDLPKKAECVICTARGTMLGDLKVAAGVTYKGKPYYFCLKEEVEEFSKNPESFLPRPIPRPAPALALPSLARGGTAAGPQMNLAELKGTVALVDFWATWCGPCVAAMPDLQKLHDKYAGKGFTVIGVSTDEQGAAKVAPFLSKRFKGRVTYPILLDTGGEKGVWKTWGVVALPAMFLVKDGQIIAQWTGRINVKEVERAITQALDSP